MATGECDNPAPRRINHCSESNRTSVKEQSWSVRSIWRFVAVDRFVAISIEASACLKLFNPDDSLLPGFKFRVPVMITLDTLKSEDVGVRRIGETWMRCSLKSYLRSVKFFFVRSESDAE